MTLPLSKLIQQALAQHGLDELLKVLLTPSEHEEILRRTQVLQLLVAGMKQREVAKTIGVGIATVTRGARELASMDTETLQLFRTQ